MRHRSIIGLNENSSSSEQIATLKHRSRIALGIGAVSCVVGLTIPVINAFTGNNLGMEATRVVEFALESVGFGAIALAGVEVFSMIDLEESTNSK